MTGFGLIRGETTASLAIRGDGGNDTLTVTTPSGAQQVTLTPGTTVDSGHVQVSNLLPLTFSNLGAAGGLALADFGATRVDSLTYRGTSSGDNFALAATSGQVTLNGQIAVTTAGVTNLVLEGLGGDDQFTVNAAQPYANLTLSGGDSSQNGDLVTLHANAAATATDRKSTRLNSSH